jgi:O-methyltransferase
MSQQWNYLTGWSRYYALWRKYADRTMLPRKTVFGNLFVADNHRRRHALTGGCFVECGTWRGGMAFSLTELLNEITECHYFDSFEGLPPAGEWDGEKAQREQAEGKLWHNNNTAAMEDFLAGMRPLENSGRQLQVHKGWFEKTLPTFSPDKEISVLRLDGDWYESTICILENLYDKVAANGLILIDDYYDWDGCSRAVHDFLSDQKLPERIRQSRYGGVAYIVKENLEP